MNKNTTTPKLDPHIELISAVAGSIKGICPVESPMIPANIASFSITARVRDPYSRLLRASHLAIGTLDGSQTIDEGLVWSRIRSPSEELCFYGECLGNMNRVGSSTVISLEITEQMLLALQLYEADLMDIDDRRQPLTIDTLWRLLRHRIFKLGGFRHIAAIPYEDTSPVSLSGQAKLLMNEIGQDISDPLKVKEVLDDYQKRDHLFEQQPHVPKVISDVRAYAIEHLCPSLGDLLPDRIFHMHQCHRATCEGCVNHGATSNAYDRWSIEAWPSAAAVEKAKMQLYSLIQDA